MPPESETKSNVAAEKNPGQEGLIEETRELLMYAAEEVAGQKMTAGEMAQFYGALDLDKRQAFARQEKLEELPHSVLDLLMKDDAVAESLRQNPTFFAKRRFFSVREWLQIHGIRSPEQIVGQGRHLIARLIGRVQEREEKGHVLLRPEEIGAIQNMAGHIPDPEVIEGIIRFIKTHPEIGLSLLKNPFFGGPVEGMEEKDRSVKAREWLSQLILMAKASLNSNPQQYHESPLCQILVQTYSMVKTGFMNEAIRKELLQMAQSYPEVARAFINSDKETVDDMFIREILSVGFVRKQVNSPRWHPVFRDLRLHRPDACTDPIKIELIQNPDMEEFLRNPFRR